VIAKITLAYFLTHGAVVLFTVAITYIGLISTGALLIYQSSELAVADPAFAVFAPKRGKL